MSFSLSSTNIRIENRDGHTHLLANAKNEEGNENHTELNLDELLGNEDGRFYWGGSNFTETAESVTFSIEGGGDVPVLRARLRNAEGAHIDADVNLAERIENDNGILVFN